MAEIREIDSRKITPQNRLTKFCRETRQNLTILMICCSFSLSVLAFDDCHVLGRLGDIFVDQRVSMKSLKSANWMKATSLMALVSLSAPATDVPTKELIGILFSSVRATENGSEFDLRGALQQWRIRNGIGFQFLFPEEVEREILNLQLQGKISREEEQIESHGFILELAWNLMVANKKFPIMDPHDVINHSIQFLIPGFSEALIEKAKVTSKWLQRRENKIYPILDVDKFDLSFEGALNRALEWNRRVIRTHTYENLPVIYRSDKGGDLVVLGNAASSIAIDLFEDVSGLHNKIADSLLGSVSRISHMSFPDVNQFFRAESEMQRQLKLLLAKVGESEPSRSQIRAKLLTILKTADPSRPAAMSREKVTTKIMQAFAKSAQEDSQLAAFFDTNNRIELLRLSTSFMDKFLTWKETKRPSTIMRFLFGHRPRTTTD